MKAMSSDREDRWLITVIGAAVLLIVLAVAYLAYQAAPSEGARAESTALPESRSAPEPQPEAAAGGTQDSAPADDGSAQPSTVDSSTPNPTQPPAEPKPEKEGHS